MPSVPRFTIGQFRHATPSPISGDAVISEITLERLAQIATQEGFFVIAAPEFDARLLHLKVSGWNVLLFLNETGDDLHAYTAVRGAAADLEMVNRWNQSKRFCRACLDADGDLVLESDLDLAGGVTEQAIANFFKLYSLILSAFQDEVCRSPRPVPNGRKTAERPMKKYLPWVLVVALTAAAAGRATAPPESAALAQLQQAVAELTTRIDSLERSPREDVRAVPPSQAKPWLARDRWRQLREGMSADEVRKLFGEPSVVRAIGKQLAWSYERLPVPYVRGEVRLREGRVNGWSEPAQWEAGATR